MIASDLFVVWVRFELFYVVAYVGVLGVNKVLKKHEVVDAGKRRDEAKRGVKQLSDGFIGLIGLQSILQRAF